MKPEKMTDEALAGICQRMESGETMTATEQRAVLAHAAALTAERDEWKTAHGERLAAFNDLLAERDTLRERVRALEARDQTMREAQDLIARAADRLRRGEESAESRLSAIRQRAGDRVGLERVVHEWRVRRHSDLDLAVAVTRYLLGEDAPGATPESADSRRCHAPDHINCPCTWDPPDACHYPTPESAGEGTGAPVAPCVAASPAPSTAEAFAAVRAFVGRHNDQCAATMAPIPCDCGAEERVALLSLLERRMGAMGRAGQNAASVLNDGARLLSLALCGELTSQEHVRATMRHMEDAGKAVLSALTDAPPVFTLEEVEQAARDHCMPGDASRLIAALRR